MIGVCVDLNALEAPPVYQELAGWEGLALSTNVTQLEQQGKLEQEYNQVAKPLLKAQGLETSCARRCLQLRALLARTLQLQPESLASSQF